MERKFLVYIGRKKEGKITVKAESALSPFRVVQYYAGMRLRLGYDIPEKTADRLTRTYRDLFTIETEMLTEQEAFADQFTILLRNYCERLTVQEIVYLMNSTLINLIEDLPDAEGGFEAQFKFLVKTFKTELTPDKVAKILKKVMAAWRKE